jgi:hypothetical protein
VESKEEFMKKGTALVTTVFAMATFPLVAQQPSSATQPTSPAAQQNPSGMTPQSSQAAAPETAAAEMSPVSGELVSKLDSKTAKTGDSVVVQTKAAVKTADGTEIPKGSKLMGQVMAVHPSASGDNSQLVVKFDHLELKGGQSVPVHSKIESIAPAGSATSAAMNAAPAAGSSNPNPNGSSRASGAPQSTSGGESGAGAGAATTGNGGAPAAGTIVARTGNIAIRTTSVPDVLVANNEPGQADPRMAQASSILLGAKQDIQLDGGTQMVVGVSAAGGGTQ